MHRGQRGIWLKVTFSASYGREDNRSLLDAGRLHAIVADLDSDLRRIGVSVDPRRMLVGRLDVARDLVLPSPVAAYVPVLEHRIRPPRMEPVRPGPTSLRWQNKQRSLAIYDKGAELVQRGHSPSEEDVLRVELRLLKAQAVQRALHMTTLSDLLSGPHRPLQYFMDTMGQYFPQAPSMDPMAITRHARLVTGVGASYPKREAPDKDSRAGGHPRTHHRARWA